MVLNYVVLFSITIGFATFSSAAEQANESWWPQFRGPNANGIANSGNYPVAFGPDNHLLWKTPLPSGVSSPCIWADKIFLTAYVPKAQRLETICLDRASGKTLWSHTAPATQIEKAYEVGSPASATPATDGHRVYVYFSSYGMLCYAMDGTELWKKPLRMPQTYFGSGTSPVVIGELVILNRDEGVGRSQDETGKWTRKPPESHLLAVNCLTGDTVWLAKRSVSRPGYSTPVYRRNGSVDEVLLAGSGQLTAYDLSDGGEIWSLDGLPPRTIATPSISANRLFMVGADLAGAPENVVPLPSFDQFLRQHDADRDGKLALREIPADVAGIDRFASDGAGNTPLSRAAGRQDGDRDGHIDADEWKNLINARVRLSANFKVGIYSVNLPAQNDSTAPAVDRVETKGVPEVPSPLYYQGRLYVIKNGGIIYCRDPGTGKVIKRKRLPATGGYYASPVGAAGRIYVASDLGVITVLAAGDDLEVLAQNDLSERIMATPALVGGTVYVRTERSMHAFAEPKN